MQTHQHRLLRSNQSYLLVLFFALQIGAVQVSAESSSALPQNELNRLSTSTQWMKLGHYVKTWFGRLESQADGMQFFLSPDGKQSPQAELKATWNAFSRADEFKNDETHPACRFPARWLWLRRELPQLTQTWKVPTCARYQQFVAALKPHSVSLIFSSYYLNNPSSSFGHTFLRISKHTPAGQDHYDLLDYGLNYAATVDTGNALLYAWRGMFGGFKGEFTNVPYYYKVQEYNDAESRDIWEYNLNLTPQEVQMLTAHFWELGQTFFYYYYLTENCSYHMLTALEAAAPRLHLTDRVPFWVIPSDTVKALFTNPGLVGAVQYRPSRRSIFAARYQHLSTAEQVALKNWLSFDETQLKPQQTSLEKTSLSQSEKAHVLDAAIDYFDFRNYRALATDEPQARAFKQNLLVTRSELGPSEDFVVPTPTHETPHIGHDSARAAVGWSRLSGARNSLLLTQRFALHDLRDPHTGYPRDAELEFLNVSARVLWKDSNSSEPQVRLDDSYLFQAQSLSPIQPLLRNLSWKSRLGVERVYDGSCDECMSGVFGGGAGGTLQLSPKVPLFITGLLEGELSTAMEYDNRWKLAVGPNLIVRWVPTAQWKLLASASYSHLLWVAPQDTMKIQAEARYSPSTQWALGAKTKSQDRFWEHQLSAYYYY